MRVGRACRSRQVRGSSGEGLQRFVKVFFHDGATWTVSPGSRTPLVLELLPVTASGVNGHGLRREPGPS